MNESNQAIVAVRREVQLSEWQRQVQERQEQGIPVDAWCASLGISKGAYYHRLRKVREYMCQQMVVFLVIYPLREENFFENDSPNGLSQWE